MYIWYTSSLALSVKRTFLLVYFLIRHGFMKPFLKPLKFVW